jgi:hypothetical protein
MDIFYIYITMMITERLLKSLRSPFNVHIVNILRCLSNKKRINQNKRGVNILYDKIKSIDLNEKLLESLFFQHIIEEITKGIDEEFRNHPNLSENLRNMSVSLKETLLYFKNKTNFDEVGFQMSIEKLENDMDLVTQDDLNITLFFNNFVDISAGIYGIISGLYDISNMRWGDVIIDPIILSEIAQDLFL